MKDLHINIGGPRDNARQQLSFHVQQGDRPGIDPKQIGRLLGEFRTAMGVSSLSSDDVRRIERHLASIEEESQSPKPLLAEIEGSLSSVQRLVQSAQSLAPALLGPLHALAVGLGLSLGR